ncbi:hypothetical protein LNN31_15690 [Acetobacterium wieringae]|uniref:Uncharacterized protein n=1 Tax=Acetobacterium wieringae TaxID=52694 RepID=A0ABY6HCH6_9FIRM|nr:MULTISPECIES: hypothetical protein [Acetobacterium]OXS26442.1 MAG: hypothetical protein BI182_15285 [Acetobacterium sp. MES1]UYO62210.1 hypothetical protein LNN31_15690 [Acetobacterium wieringae]VUZ26063.1 Uncharacterised protein [Acetobacterium wieringae]
MKTRYIILSVVLIGVLIAGAVFMIPKLMNDEKTTDQKTTAEETTTTKQPDQIKNNLPDTTATTAIVVPQDMQTVISENQADLYVDEAGLLAGNYPIQMVPLYGVTSVSESNQITTAAGKPGWKAAYVSDFSTDEILSFYQSLLAVAPDYSEETVSESTNLKGTVSGYTISLTISPNNPDKTDLPGVSAVGIFIEQV